MHTFDSSHQAQQRRSIEEALGAQELPLRWRLREGQRCDEAAAQTGKQVGRHAFERVTTVSGRIYMTYLAEGGTSQLHASAVAAQEVLNSSCWRSLSARSREIFL